MKDKYNQIARLKCFHLTFCTMFDFFFRYNVINVFGGLAAKETRLSISKVSIALLYCFCFSFLFPIFSIKFWLYWIFERCNSLEPGGLYYWLIEEQALALARVFLYCVCGYYICILWCPFQECKWLLANCQGDMGNDLHSVQEGNTP